MILADESQDLTALSRAQFGASSFLDSHNDDARDWALDKARKILVTHQPESLTKKISIEMDKIIASLESK